MYFLVVGVRQIFAGDIYTQDLEALDNLHIRTIVTEWGMYSTPLPEVDDQLFDLLTLSESWWSGYHSINLSISFPCSVVS